jgi:segregation and condensation protein A
MTDSMTDSLDSFVDSPPRDEPSEDGVLMVAVGSFEGPLDLLLHLARTQKVDLARVSILALVEQYLAYVAEARRLKLELAADYLVMAAWLAYLKSRLLLPADPDDEEPSAELLAARLAAQLQRLEAMRDVGARLMARDRLGRDMFPRGAPEGLKIVKRKAFDTTFYELLKAYADVKGQSKTAVYSPQRRIIFALEAALERLERLIGQALDWMELSAFLPIEGDAAYRRSALASTFVASLELARLGQVDIQQMDLFGPLYLRRRSAPAA